MKKVIKARKVIDRGRPVRSQNTLWPYVFGYGLFLLLLSLVVVALFAISRFRSALPIGLPELTSIPILPTFTPTVTATLTQIPSQTSLTPEPDEPEPIIAVMTGSVWVWDSAEGGEILSAAIPKGAEVVVVEYGLHRTHIIWQGGEARVEGWVNSNWVETIDG